jgi:hypothetical protein
VRIEGQTYADVQQALCADTVIVTAEEIVEEDVLRSEAERNAIPFFAVKYVCHVPYGAHPYAVYNYYDYDPLQLKEYHESARMMRPMHSISKNTYMAWKIIAGILN